MMLFAAVAHALFGIPEGDMDRRIFAPSSFANSCALTDLSVATESCLRLADIFDQSVEEVPDWLASFKVAIAGTTQRIRSRSVRFRTLYQALLPKPI